MGGLAAAGEGISSTVTASSRQLGDHLLEELQGLPEAHREAFTLVQLDGLSLAEAAQVLGTTVPAVKLRAFRAYEALRERLGDEVRDALGDLP